MEALPFLVSTEQKFEDQSQISLQIYLEQTILKDLFCLLLNKTVP